MKLYVANFPYATDEEDLQDFFIQRGFPPVSVKICFDRETDEPRGFGFVELRNREQGLAAANALHGKDFNGRKLLIREAAERQERERGERSPERYARRGR